MGRKGGAMQNRLTPNPQIVVEAWEGHLGDGDPPRRGRDPSPILAPQPRGQCWEEEFPQPLAVKISEDSECPS